MTGESLSQQRLRRLDAKGFRAKGTAGPYQGSATTTGIRRARNSSIQSSCTCFCILRLNSQTLYSQSLSCNALLSRKHDVMPSSIPARENDMEVVERI